MTSSLTNVAARVLFPDRSVRPRVASVFEPQAGNSANEAIALETLNETTPSPAPAVRRRPAGVTALAPYAQRDDLTPPEASVHASQSEPRLAHLPQPSKRPTESNEALPQSQGLKTHER